MIKSDEELVEGCKRFLEEMKRIEAAKAKKAEEEKQKETRRQYWAKVLHLTDRQGVSIIIPKNSKFR